jgi:hypothetical protein
MPMSFYAPSPLPGGTIDANLGGQVTNQGIYVASATQNYMLGTLYKSKTGKCFRYSYNGAVAIPLLDATHGNLQQSSVNASTLNALFVNKAQTVNYATAAVGNTEITVDCTTGGIAAGLVDNYFAGGRMSVKAGAGIGDAYDIVASKLDCASGTATDTNLHLLLATPIRTALAATSYITLRPNAWNGTIIAPTTISGKVAGVCVAPYPFSTTSATVVPVNYYYWAQTKGEAPVLIDGTVVVGQSVVPSGSIAGAVAASAQTVVGTTSAVTAMLQIVGIVRDIGATQNIGLIDLMLE